MAIDFPDSPSSGDTYTTGGRTWQWDGTTWKSYGNYPDPTVLKIDPANNRVGINNTSPTVALDVTGDAAVSGNLAVGVVTDVEADITGLQAGATATSIKVYANASDRTTAVPSPAAGDLSFLTSTASVEVYDGTAWVSVGGATMITKVAKFTASGTWTVPADVTYAVAHMRGGGGGATFSGLGTSGGPSSVAFSGGTVTAAGGNGAGTQFAGGSTASAAPAVNSGEGGYITQLNGDKSDSTYGGRGAYIVAADTVTPAASITVTVGAGGTGSRAGASGYVWIEYQEPA